MSFFSELRRRNVFRVSGVYAIAGWVLLQVAAVLEGAMSLPAWFDAFALSIILLGFPLALILAWAFELTPDGIQRTSEVDPAESFTARTGSKLDVLLVLGLFALAVALLMPRFFLDRGEQSTSDQSAVGGESVSDVTVSADPSIAVLAFEDMSPEGTEAYFADGVAEEILNLLAKTDGLKVAARTSSFAFKGSQAGAGEIGKQLQVAHILEGSVRRAGDDIRVTAQLINAETGFHLWSETYDRELTNVFAIQDDIAAKILAALEREILGLQIEAPETRGHQAENLQAYKEFLQGKQLLSQQTEDSITEGISHFEEAMSLEPDFALPYAYAAYGWMLLDTQQNPSARGLELDDRVEPLIEKSLSLAPENPEVIAILGRYQFLVYRYDEAQASLDKAISISPNFALAHTWRASNYERLGELDRMLRDREMAYRLDPLSIATARSLVYTYRNFQRYEDADRVTDTLLEIYPDNEQLHSMRMMTLFVQGRYGEMALLAETAHEQFPASEEIKQILDFGLLNIGMAENIADPDAWVRREVAIAQGDVAAQRAIIDEQDSTWDWEMHYQYAHGTAEGLTQAVDGYIAQLEEKNYPWRTHCDLVHALFFQEVGKVEAFSSIMSQCRQEYEPALETGYLCYCNWISVINYLILSGREAQAIQKLFEWFAKGGSYVNFPELEVIALLQDRPEYEEFLQRNAANLQRKQHVYERAKLRGP